MPDDETVGPLARCCSCGRNRSRRRSQPWLAASLQDCRNAGWDTSSHTRRHTGTGSGQGQAAARVADTYGDVTLRIQVDAIAKLPWIEVMSLP